MKIYNPFFLAFLLILCSLNIYSQNQITDQILKKVNFTISSTGEQVFEIVIPQGVKKVKAVITDHTEMLKIELIGPTNIVLGKNSTWSNMSNWQKPLKCSASVVNNDRQKPGKWKIRVIGAVQKNKTEKIKTVSGILTIYTSDNFDNSNTSGNDFTEKEFSFNVPANGEKVFEINVPQNAKKVKAVITGHTDMLKIELIGPSNIVLGKNSTWSDMSNWQKPLKCSASVANNNRQKPGVWKVKVIGAVQKSKVEKVKTVSGNLKVTIE